jgi:alpha-glucosidase
MTWDDGRRPSADADWWRQAVVYEIYPRSFADADGDGIGDLRGILSRLNHLTALGIDAVWLTPFYPSELADGGYDVIDHRDIDPRIGTLEDFDALVEGLHATGLRVIIDIVPNHTSDQHPWFLEALAAGRGSPARQRYHFHDGAGPDGDQPPSDWTSLFGGSAWEKTSDGQWFLHTFAVEQPDLNWANEEVREEFLDILRFWADRGVDGLRVDAAHMLAKDLGGPLPSQAELDLLPQDGQHPTLDRAELREIYRGWRAVLNTYDPPPMAVAEAAVPAERVPMYASPDTLGQSFFFDLLLANYDAATFRQVIDDCLRVAAASGSSVTWVLNNHDSVRTATRYGTRWPGTTPDGLPIRKHGSDWLLGGGDPVQLDAAQGLRRAKAAALLMLALPGSAYLYQGEELGLQEVAEIPDEARTDPSFFRNRSVEVGRDGCRVPLPWTRSGSSYGFGTGSSHLPQPRWFGLYSVEAQEADPGSTLSLYQRALQLRPELQASESLGWVPARDDVLHLTRPGGWHVISNFGHEPYPKPTGTVVLSSADNEDVIPGESTVWMTSGHRPAGGEDTLAPGG